MGFLRGMLLTGAIYISASAPVSASDFIYGADLSFANEMDDCGAVYRDGSKPGDVYAIFKEHGTNLIRLRLWVNPSWTKYGTLDDVKRSMARAKAQGLAVLLDLHYSDDWADGDKQIIPATWAPIKSDDELAQTVYRYTRDTLTELAKAGLKPAMVQVGNETNGEVMMPAATKEPIHWTRNAKLLKAGIKAVRDSDPHIKVMLHIAQPENVEPWFAAAETAGVTDFDVIGMSYYSKWSKFSLIGLGATINRLRYRYPKAEIMVAETAYAWTGRGQDHSPNLLGDDSLLKGYPASVDGQKKFLTDLTQTIIANGGKGVIYWAPDWLSTRCSTRWGQGSNWENATLFDFDGNALPGLDYTKATYQQPATVRFHFHGLTPPPDQEFYLWGDFLGSKSFAVRLPDDGNFTTTIMPGTTIRFQVFDSLQLHVKLLHGGNQVQDFATETIPASDASFDYVLTKPQSE